MDRPQAAVLAKPELYWKWTSRRRISVSVGAKAYNDLFVAVVLPG